MKKPNPKTAARLLAVQSYYSQLIDKSLSNENALSASSEILANDNIKSKKKFAEDLLSFAVAEKESIDFIINKYALAKNSEAMNPLVLAILTIAMAELLKDNKTDRPIILSEYLLITSEFFDSGETGFVNAVLDRFIKESAIPVN